MNERSVRQNFKRLDYLHFHQGMLNVVRLIGASALLLLCIILIFKYFTLPIAIPLSVLASLIHQRELSEWIHESSHFNLIPSKKWNDLIIQWFAGYLFANDIRAHRFGHNDHHRQAEFFIDKDPDTRLFGIKNRQQFWREIAKDLTGITALSMFFSRSAIRCPSPTSFFMIKLAVYQSVLLAICWWLGYLPAYFIYYATLVTLYPLLNRMRLYGQHMELGRGTGGGSSRTIDAGVVDRVLITSKLMLYHYEHHAFPDLPYRALIAMPRISMTPNTFSENRWKLMLQLYRELPSERF